LQTTQKNSLRYLGQTVMIERLLLAPTSCQAYDCLHYHKKMC